MFNKTLIVKYVTSKNCFCTLSQKNFKYLQSTFLILVTEEKKNVFVSVDSPSEIDDETFGINSLFAKSLNIEDKALVTVSETPKAPIIRSVTITALNQSDHEILEMLADKVQSTLLEQIQVLSNGQNFVIWIGNTLNVIVNAYDISPASPGVIHFLTEVVIKPPGAQKTIKTSTEAKSQLDIFTNYSNDRNLVLRLVPFVDLVEKLGEYHQPFNIFTFKSTFSQIQAHTKETPCYCFLKLLTSNENEKVVYARLYLFEDIVDNFKLSATCPDNLFVSNAVMDYFNCSIGAHALVELYTGPLPSVDEIEIFTKKNYTVYIKELFQQYLADNCKKQSFVINPNIVITLPQNCKCFVRFQPCEAKFCNITPDFVRNCKLTLSYESLPVKEVVEKSEFCLDKYKIDVANFEDIIDKSVFLFIHNRKIHCKMYNILITGKTGTGKSTLLEIVNNLITAFPYFIYTKKIDCKSIKGKTVDSLHKLFLTAMFDLIHHQPAVLILDDLHMICENVNENDALAQNAVYFNRVSEMLEDLFQSFRSCNAVGILASSEDTSKLNKKIYSSRGNHLFQNVYNIEQLEEEDRRKLLKYFFTGYQLIDVDLDNFTKKTESFVMQDMFDFATKTQFESFLENHDKVVMTISQKHCEKAFEAVLLTFLKGANLPNAWDKELTDIGGLSDVKKNLVETMLWPSKYPNLFTNAPLRLPSGLLLYGPPGTGKTIVAGAAARHCNLRLISIKGPELLSKYIGASEQAVREVFERAQSAKPCVLFFDEFDSLAPRRGHDNTGVTDRVVNQLLTQLDGVETLCGVFVLAATSRPDLLDPALLRPGRLDRHIRCWIPTKGERQEILQVLSRHMHLSSDVDLAELARLTEGFSGADLQAVLYTAQLECVKLIDDEAELHIQEEIQQAQLIEALRNTRPSLTKAELVKYEQIYRKFEGGDSGVFVPGSRATLA